jgi:hypothetical protein
MAVTDLFSPEFITLRLSYKPLRGELPIEPVMGL